MPFDDGGLLDTVWLDFVNAISGNWGPYLSAYLYPLLLALVCLQFGMIAIEAAIGRDVPLVLVHIMLGILRLGVVVAIFQNADVWGNDIILTFQQIGSNLGGSVGTFTPSSVFNQGGIIMGAIFAAKASGGWFTELIQSFEFFVAGISVMIAWALASLLYLGVLVEVALIVYAGPLIICVAPLTWTGDLLMIWGRNTLALGFKVALILMTLGVANALANQWLGAMDPTSFTTNLWNLFIMPVESAIFIYALWKVPSRLSGLTPGAAILGFGEAVAGMASSAADTALAAAGHSGGGSSGGSSHGGSAAANSRNNAQARAQSQQVQSKLTV